MTTIRAKIIQPRRKNLIWPDEVIIFLITRVRDAPYVWDRTHFHFNTNNLKIEFWLHLAKTMHKRFRFLVSPGDLIAKWRSLTQSHATTKISKNDQAEAIKNRKFFKLLEFLQSSKQKLNEVDGLMNDFDALDANPKQESQQNENTSEKLLTKVKVQSSAAPRRISNTSKNNEVQENSSILDDDDDDVEMIEPIPINNTRREDANTPSYHYGMAIAKDVFELSEDLKIDAKIEIMQIIGKYQKRQLHRNT